MQTDGTYIRFQNESTPFSAQNLDGRWRIVHADSGLLYASIALWREAFRLSGIGLARQVAGLPLLQGSEVMLLKGFEFAFRLMKELESLEEHRRRHRGCLSCINPLAAEQGERHW